MDQEPCLAMTVKNEYLLTLHRSKINIFAFACSSDQTITKHLVSLDPCNRVDGGFFLDPMHTELEDDDHDAEAFSRDGVRMAMDFDFNYDDERCE